MIIKPIYYPAIRAAIDIQLMDALTLPDEVIELPIYLDQAEIDVIGLDADAATRTGDELTMIQNAIIYRIAAYICPSVPHLVSNQVLTSRQQWKDKDWQAHARILLSRSNQLINQVLNGVTSVIEPPNHFTLAQKDLLA